MLGQRPYLYPQRSRNDRIFCFHIDCQQCLIVSLLAPSSQSTVILLPALTVSGQTRADLFFGPSFAKLDV